MYTHVKRPYRATCLQFDGSNIEEVSKVLEATGARCVSSWDKNPRVLIRFARGELRGLIPGDWVRVGEDGDVRVYPDEIFKERYMELNEGWIRSSDRLPPPDVAVWAWSRMEGAGIAFLRVDSLTKEPIWWDVPESGICIEIDSFELWFELPKGPTP